MERIAQHYAFNQWPPVSFWSNNDVMADQATRQLILEWGLGMLQIKDLCCGYGDMIVIRDINFDLRREELLL